MLGTASRLLHADSRTPHPCRTQGPRAARLRRLGGGPFFARSVEERMRAAQSLQEDVS